MFFPWSLWCFSSTPGFVYTFLKGESRACYQPIQHCTQNEYSVCPEAGNRIPMTAGTVYQKRATVLYSVHPPPPRHNIVCMQLLQSVKLCCTVYMVQTQICFSYSQSEQCAIITISGSGTRDTCFLHNATAGNQKCGLSAPVNYYLEQ